MGKKHRYFGSREKVIREMLCFFDFPFSRFPFMNLRREKFLFFFHKRKRIGVEKVIQVWKGIFFLSNETVVVCLSKEII